MNYWRVCCIGLLLLTALPLEAAPRRHGWKAFKKWVACNTHSIAWQYEHQWDKPFACRLVNGPGSSGSRVEAH